MPVPVIAAAGRAAAGMAHEAAPHRIGNITAFFMLFAAFLLEGFQFFLTILPIPVIGWVLSMFVGLFSLVVFSVWFIVLGVSIIGGRKAGIKIASAMTAAVVEVLPLVGALPGTTVGVLGMIIASRLEDRHRKPAVRTSSTIRTGPRKLERPPQAANDNEQEEYRQAA